MTHEFWGRAFTFAVIDGDVRIETEGYTSALAFDSLGGDPLTPAGLDDPEALDAACETYCLASGIEPLDD